MAIVTPIANLKARFAAGMVPSASDFVDLIDTLSALPVAGAVDISNIPAGGDLIGNYPNPQIQQQVVGLHHLNWAEAAAVALNPGALAIPVYDRTTRQMTYQAWATLPGIAQPTVLPPVSSGTPGTGVGTSPSTLQLINGTWQAFPAMLNQETPVTLLEHSVGTGLVIVQVWGEAISLKDTAGTGSQFGYKQGSIIPLSRFYTRDNSTPTRYHPLFNVYVASTNAAALATTAQSYGGVDLLWMLAQASLTGKPAGTYIAPFMPFTTTDWNIRLQTLVYTPPTS